MAFLDGDNFSKAFAGALVNMSYQDMTNSLVLLQKLCKNCPHPEKLHCNISCFKSKLHRILPFFVVMAFYGRIAILRVEADIDVKFILERYRIVYGVFVRDIESFKNWKLIWSRSLCKLYNFHTPLPTLMYFRKNQKKTLFIFSRDNRHNKDHHSYLLVVHDHCQY